MGLDMSLYKKKKDSNGHGAEIAYWRKFNALHNYFVTHFQDGEDHCNPSKFISKEDLQKLVQDLREDNLQPVDGFFFGSTNKDEWYHEQRKESIVEIKKIIDNTDWESEVVYYQSSW